MAMDMRNLNNEAEGTTSLHRLPTLFFLPILLPFLKKNQIQSVFPALPTPQLSGEKGRWNLLLSAG